MKIRDFHHAANLHLSKENDFWPELAHQKLLSSWGAANPTIGTLGRGHSTRTCVLVVKREFWFYRAAMCSHEGRSCRVRDFFEFTWHSFTWIKIILWQIIVIMKVDGQYYFIFLIWSVDYYSILSLSTLQPTMRCFRIPCIPFLFWPAWLCRNLCLLIS